jgi:geranylgeranyl diphosphate synthase type II
MADQNLQAWLEHGRELIERRLRAELQRVADGPAALAEAMRYGLLAPGKRLRPLLVLAAVEACGGLPEPALPAACAVEMVHAYSLIHDDLPAMDDDDLRRGQPTCHKRFGEALAILAGDGLLTLAFQVLAESYPAPTAAACCRELARGAGATGMVGGQVADLAWEGRIERPGASAPCRADLEAVHAAKTGALFRAALRLGAYVAHADTPDGPPPALLHSLDSYGQCLGQVFQITDDLLDVEGRAEHTGKRVGKDADRGKLTYPGLLGRQVSRRCAEELCERGEAQLASLPGPGRQLTTLLRSLLGRDR